LDLWLGRHADAAETAADAVQRAEQFGGKPLLITSWTCQAAVDAYSGRQGQARAAARSAIQAARVIGTGEQVAPAVATLGFLETSLGDYAAALTELEPVMAAFNPAHDTEIMVGGYLPVAIEALTAVGRSDEAELFVKALETAGAQQDRPWMLATGARGRSHVHAARGELDAAERAAREALHHHRRLPMPFEVARTQLVLGQILRRRRRRQLAQATVREALAAFERLDTPLWVRRARIELDRLDTAASDGDRLTAAERRIAERAAAGLSNKQIAAELFIAPKTVETNLSSVYRKLGIRSRAALSSALRPGNAGPQR
jgi:DNA-binding CsgD family transcriptional regulator